MKIFLDSIGCRLNQSEIEKIAANLRDKGHELVGDASEADMAIVNTCAVTAAASADSRKSIRRIAKSGCIDIRATGCYTTIDPTAIEELPAVTNVYENSRKDSIISDIKINHSKIISTNFKRIPLPGKKRRTRAFIKVQDGCDNFCTYCITRVARGKNRSVSKEGVFADITRAMNGGAKEIVLTGVNLGAWGRDLDHRPALPMLVESIIQNLAPARLRLSSLEPWDMDGAYFPLFKHPSFCNHLHLPLQSGSNLVLKKMGRKMTSEAYRKLIYRIRSQVENIAITTDIMVGFPGETKKEFEESLSFIRSMHFSGGHVFRYSSRPGTAAEKLDNQVSEQEKRRRSLLMRRAIKESSVKFRKRFIDCILPVLWEKAEKTDDALFTLHGLTGNYLRVKSTAGENLYNIVSKVQLRSLNGSNLEGIIVP
jgi:threonylcarbamoyladenosine tRNA methylthiotransferase MtaB